jgi:hypothetical protein
VADFVGAVDQGTTSTRFMIFDQASAEVARHQLEHTQIMPRPGWVEHDPAEIWARTQTVIETTLREAGLRAPDLAAVGLTNQRETSLVWNRRTGLRGRPGHRLLARHRQAARQLARVQALVSVLDRRPPRGRLRRLAQSRPAHPRLGKGRFIPNEPARAPPTPRPCRRGAPDGMKPRVQRARTRWKPGFIACQPQGWSKRTPAQGS